jgi:hypothetical protein
MTSICSGTLLQLPPPSRITSSRQERGDLTGIEAEQTQLTLPQKFHWRGHSIQRRKEIKMVDIQMKLSQQNEEEEEEEEEEEGAPTVIVVELRCNKVREISGGVGFSKHLVKR